MKKPSAKKILSVALLVLLLVALVIFLNFISPEEIVEKIGVRNGYLLAFLVSLFGGFSAGGSVTFISLLLVLAAGGLTPLYLGLVSGTSLAIGDILMFYTGAKGRELISGKWDTRIHRLTEAIDTRPSLRKFIPFGSYLYIGFAPLPNDILLLFLAAIEYPLRRMIPIIILGDLTFATVLTVFAAQGMS